jgi:hypothetical protein
MTSGDALAAWTHCGVQQFDAVNAVPEKIGMSRFEVAWTVRIAT